MALAGSLGSRAVSTHCAGKRSALKGARSVWKGGKTVKSYLSLPSIASEWKGGTPATVIIGKIAFAFPIHSSTGRSLIRRRQPRQPMGDTHDRRRSHQGAARQDPRPHVVPRDRQ